MQSTMCKKLNWINLCSDILLSDVRNIVWQVFLVSWSFTNYSGWYIYLVGSVYNNTPITSLIVEKKCIIKKNTARHPVGTKLSTVARHYHIFWSCECIAFRTFSQWSPFRATSLAARWTEGGIESAERTAHHGSTYCLAATSCLNNPSIQSPKTPKYTTIKLGNIFVSYTRVRNYIISKLYQN